MLCRRKKICYIENNFSNWTIVHQLITKLVDQVLKNSGLRGRGDIRIKYYPITKINVEIRKWADYHNLIQGFVNDLSVGGLSIVLRDHASFEKFSLKEALQLKIKFPRNTIKIAKAYIVRIEPGEGLLGISFNMSNFQMIEKKSANTLLAIIHYWINSVIENCGKFSIQKKVGISETSEKYYN
jgi:hypothetical protein